ncbi:hypothetical protein [Micromonospora sp. CB01531]|uniref:hypothetical protein n=1 Tax=Micromonospora sp. CB01531 TaxID=1718947 RepID=UPI000A4E89C2|nr:hypothetical protein [Micromonospora sp. CB01531]
MTTSLLAYGTVAAIVDPDAERVVEFSRLLERPVESRTDPPAPMRTTRPLADVAPGAVT